MLKLFSFLVISASAVFHCSCSTTRFADAFPETRGTEIGKVPIGKRNVDFFVVPDENAPHDIFGKFTGENSKIIVFKTEEQHPLYKAAEGVTAPVRMVEGAVTGVLESALAAAFFWADEKPSDSPAPQAYPPRPAQPSPVPTTVPQPRPPAPVVAPKEIQRIVREELPESEPYWMKPHPAIVTPAGSWETPTEENFAKPVADASDLMPTQENRNRG